MSPKAMRRRSRSAGSPALPTAITTRPQLASSPAIAVLTSGELAIESAMRRAERFDTARHLLGEIAEHRIERGAKRLEPRIVRPHDARRLARRAGREREQRVRG